MKFFSFLISLIFMANAFAVGIKEFPENKIRFGTSTGPREITFDQVPDGSSAKISVDPSTEELSINNKVNLTSYAVSSTTKPSKPCPEMTETQRDAIVSPGNGYCVMNTTKRALNIYDSTTSKWKVVGSGAAGGSGKVNLIENFEFEDGIDTQWQYTATKVTAGTGSDALIHTTSAIFNPSSLNDYLRTIFFTTPPGLRSASCEAQFMYKGLDRNTYARVETESGVVLGTYVNPIDGLNGLPVHPYSAYESIYFTCPSDEVISILATNGNIRLVFYQGTASDGAVGTIDNVHLGEMIGLTQSSLPDTFVANFNSSGGLISVNYEGWTSNAVVSDTSLFTIPIAGDIFPTSSPSCNVTGVSTSSTTTDTAKFNGSPTQTSVVVRTQQHNGSTYVKVASPFQLRCSRTGWDSRKLSQVWNSVPKVSSNVNSFSAKVLGSDGSITSYDVAMLSGSCTSGGTGIYNCPLISGLTTNPMNCNADSIDATDDRYCKVYSQTGTSSVQVRCYSGASAGGSSFKLSCDKVGSDFTLPTVQPFVAGQVLNSYSTSAGLTNARVEACEVTNSGTPTMASVLCNGWVQSLALSATGVVTFTIKSAYANAVEKNCVCSSVNTTSTIYSCEARQSGGSNENVSARTSSSASSAANTGFNIMCMFSY